MVLRPGFIWNILMTEAASDEDVVCREPLIEVIDQTQGDRDHDGVDTGHTYPQYRQASTPVSPARWDNLNNSLVYRQPRLLWISYNRLLKNLFTLFSFSQMYSWRSCDVQSQSLEITLLNDLFRVSKLLHRGESLLQLYSFRTCQVPTEKTWITREIDNSSQIQI